MTVPRTRVTNASRKPVLACLSRGVFDAGYWLKPSGCDVGDDRTGLCGECFVSAGVLHGEELRELLPRLRLVATEQEITVVERGHQVVRIAAH